MTSCTCSQCACYDCLYWWSFRCPYGECFDDRRAIVDPYTSYHPIRKTWSHWDAPGEQEHWCRAGSFYPISNTECSHYVHYEGQTVKTCLKANVSVFQDGYIDCSLVSNWGCRKCYEEFEEKEE